ncbi:polyprenyl synthetase family protein [Streptomyces sp. DH10]|uniref:polyprenyl synthetase family protein n=1 Tax=Streptomyces sp. DH10 TaxID=3040121 RepID=UPI003FA7494D
MAPVSRRGKSVRPALVLLSAAAVGGSAELAVPGAVAVELVHDFTLLHDDVIDGDALRRHRPAAWSVFGTPAAVLTGDALGVGAAGAGGCSPQACRRSGEGAGHVPVGAGRGTEPAMWRSRRRRRCRWPSTSPWPRAKGGR